MRPRELITLLSGAVLLAFSALVCGSITGNAAPLRIVAIGASNTHGWYVGNAGAYPAQLQALQARLVEVHVDRVELLHGRHQRRGTRLHVRALRHRRRADAALDRRCHVGVAEVDARGLHHGRPDGQPGVA